MTDFTDYVELRKWAIEVATRQHPKEQHDIILKHAKAYYQFALDYVSPCIGCPDWAKCYMHTFELKCDKARK